MAIGPMKFSTRQFTSASVNGLNLVEQIGFVERPTRPTIISKKMSMGDKVLAEFYSENLANGLKHEKYNSNGCTLEFTSDKFGNFISFDTNIKDYQFGRVKLIENIRNAIKSKFESFFEPEHCIRKNYCADTSHIKKSY